MWCRIVLHTFVETPPLLSLSLSLTHTSMSLLSPLSFLSTRTVFYLAKAFDQDPFCGPSWVGSTASRRHVRRKETIDSTVCSRRGYWNSSSADCPWQYNDRDVGGSRDEASCKDCPSGKSQLRRQHGHHCLHELSCWVVLGAGSSACTDWAAESTAPRRSTACTDCGIGKFNNRSGARRRHRTNCPAGKTAKTAAPTVVLPRRADPHIPR